MFGLFPITNKEIRKVNFTLINLNRETLQTSEAHSLGKQNLLTMLISMKINTG